MHPEPPTSARRRRAILVICDGLGHDWLSAALTPTLWAMQSRTLSCADHRAVFPSVTRVSAASVATGCQPGRHGLHGNQMALLSDDRLTVHNVGDPGFRSRMRQATGTTLRVPTMAERLADRGGQMAFSNVSPGAAYFLDPEHHGEVYHRAGSFARGGAAITGAAHLAISHDLQGDTVMTGRFLDEAVGRPDLALAILWLANPDLTTHYQPLGSPAHQEALATADRLVADVITAVEQRRRHEDILLMVGSDHGHETIAHSVHIGNWLRARGAGELLDRGRLAVASQGTAALLYAMPDARPALAPLLEAMRAEPWAGSILTGDALDEHGFGPDEALVAAIDTARTERPNAHGVPGERWMIEDGEGTPAIGCGHHGGLGPQETRPFLLIDHPSIAAGRIADTTCLIDIAPTLLDFLGAERSGMDGRSLLRRGVPSKTSPAVRRVPD